MPDAAQALAAQPPELWKRTFVGRQGIRAGWRLLIYFGAIGAILAWNWFLLRRLEAPLSRIPSPWDSMFGMGFVVAVQIIAALLMGRIERRSLADYGLPFRLIFRKQFWTGALWGAVMTSLVFAIVWAAHGYTPGSLVLSPREIAKYGLLWAVTTLVWAFFEEFSFRGYLQFTLTSGMGFWPAAVLTCLLYTVVEVQKHYIGVVRIVAQGIFLCLALRRTGNLWFGIGWGTAAMWCTDFVYAHQESSPYATGYLLHDSVRNWSWLNVLCGVVTAASCLLLAQVYPDKKYPGQPAPDVDPDAEMLSS